MYMIVLIRGHIRNSFDNDRLYHLLKEIDDLSSIELYIQTWPIFQSNISWREIIPNKKPVTEELIHDYFKELSSKIKKIMILDDDNIKYIGDISGNVGDSKAPVIGWKNMWYGNYEMINYIKNIPNPAYKNEVIVNMRFDILDNSQIISSDQVVDFVEKNKDYYSETKNIFIYCRERWGIDNIYIGNIVPMHKLITLFHYKLDGIVERYLPFKHQEYLVFFVNNELFPPPQKPLYRWADSKEIEGYFRLRNWI